MELAGVHMLPIPGVALKHAPLVPMTQEREVREAQAKHTLAVLRIHQVSELSLFQKCRMLLQQCSHHGRHNHLELSPHSASSLFTHVVES